MLRLLRDRYRACATVPRALYSFEGALPPGAEWRADRHGPAPALTLHMRPGTSVRFAVPLRGRFVLQAEVQLSSAAPVACTFTVLANRGGRLVKRRAVVRRPGDPPITLRLSAPGGVDELMLGVDGAGEEALAGWGSPIVWVPKSFGGIRRGAWARTRSLWSRRRVARGGSRAGAEAPLSRPRVSVIVVAPEDAHSESLRRCLASIEAQSRPPRDVVCETKLLEGLRRAQGDFVAILRPDGELAPDALAEIERILAARPDTDLVYSDEDRLEAPGRRRPFFKPDWSPDYCLSRLYVGQLAVYRKAILDKSAGEPGRGSEIDVLLEATERTWRVAHVPKVLWHASGPFPTSDSTSLEAHLDRHGLAARAVAGARPGCHRVKWTIQGTPLVSIVVLTRDRVHLLRRCIESVEARTRGVPYEILIVDNGSRARATHQFLADTRHAVIHDPGPFNFARLNNAAARRAGGDHLLFLNNDVEVIEDDWLVALLEHSQRAPVGAVGAKLYYPDGRLQHVGMVLGLKDGVAQVFRGAPGDHPGYFDSNMVVRNYSAVTGACLMTRREVFEAVAGFDEAFAFDYNDVDYCLRVRARGYRVVFTPHARLWHHEFATREPRMLARERSLFHRRWAAALEADPYYNPNLSRRHLDFRVARA